MKAVVYERYGPPEVLHIADMPKPVPKDDEILVRIHASTVNRLDCHTREANRSNGFAVSVLSRAVSGFRGPRQPILGTEFAGTVDAIGPAVTGFRAGDKVYGNTGLKFGCHAEFTCMREQARVGLMPANARFDEAAAVTDGAFNALWCLRQADIQPGKRVVVYGASGAIGTAGVQLARYLGADVTAVCGTKNLELAASLGAGDVIDYTRDDFTKNGQTYDVIFDAVGKHSFKRCKGSLRSGGCYLATDGFRNVLLALKRFGDKRVRMTLPPRYPRHDVVLLRELMESGRYRAVIDRRYALADVIEAARYVETQQKVGNVVLMIAADQGSG